MNEPPQVPIALTIAGSDSGGGAGIQADLKTFAALGAFGTSAITAITAQNPDGVSAMQGIEPDVVGEQIRQVMSYFRVQAVKIGMLFSSEIIQAVAAALAEQLPAGKQAPVPIVVDPVMVATSGARLLNEDAVKALCDQILPRASLITPNMDEAAILSGRPVEKDEELEPAAKAISERFGLPVLVKGGHLKNSEEAVDVLWDGKSAEFFATTFLQHATPHGTGCTLSSAIAVYLLRRFPLADAVSQAKHYMQLALAGSLPAGRGLTMNHAFAPLPLELLE
jgi:hydroxymethylpyrimidine/phosphomethylpyrimidine kinase